MPDPAEGPSAAVDVLAIGGPAPAIHLAGTDGTEAGHRHYHLADYVGSPVVVAFYPADHSPVCTVQLTTYAADISRFAALGAQVLAISPQSVEDHDAFADAHGGFGFPLLADLDHVAAEAYDVLGPLGFYRRSVFVVDANGILRWAHRSAAGFTFRSVDQLVGVIAAL